MNCVQREINRINSPLCQMEGIERSHEGGVHPEAARTNSDEGQGENVWGRDDDSSAPLFIGRSSLALCTGDPRPLRRGSGRRRCG